MFRDIDRFRLATLACVTAVAGLLQTAASASAQHECKVFAALQDLGLSPKSLSAAGMTANHTAALVDQLSSSEELAAYLQHRSAKSVAIEEHTVAQQSAQQSSGSATDTEALTAARTRLDECVLACDSSKAELWALVESLLPGSMGTQSEQVVLNQGRGLPVRYACLELSADEAHALAQASRAAGVENPPEWATGLVSAYNLHGEVQLVLTRLSSTLAALELYFQCE